MPIPPKDHKNYIDELNKIKDQLVKKDPNPNPDLLADFVEKLKKDNKLPHLPSENKYYGKQWNDPYGSKEHESPGSITQSLSSLQLQNKQLTQLVRAQQEQLDTPLQSVVQLKAALIILGALSNVELGLDSTTDPTTETS